MSNENAPWFRLRGDRWKADTRGLTPQEKAVFMDLLVEMHEREEPLSDEWLDQIRSITRTRPSTFWPAIERLVSLDLFVRVDGGLWSHFMEREIEDRRGRSDKARRNSAKSRQKSAQSLKNRPEKSQQNQWAGDAIEIQIEIDRDAPVGASQDQDAETRDRRDCYGPVPAYADRPNTADRNEFLGGEQIEIHPFEGQSNISGGHHADLSEHHREVMSACLRKLDDLAEADRRRLLEVFGRYRDRALTNADLDDLLAIHGRLEWGDEADDDRLWADAENQSSERRAR